MSPEREERRHQVHHNVVGQKAVARLGREQLADGELAYAWAAEKEDDLSIHARVMLAACNVNVSSLARVCAGLHQKC